MFLGRHSLGEGGYTAQQVFRVFCAFRGLFFNVEARNRPLRGFATLGEANTPSEASAERRKVRRGGGLHLWSSSGGVMARQLWVEAAHMALWGFARAVPA